MSASVASANTSDDDSKNTSIIASQRMFLQGIFSGDNYAKLNWPSGRSRVVAPEVLIPIVQGMRASGMVNLSGDTWDASQDQQISKEFFAWSSTLAAAGQKFAIERFFHASRKALQEMNAGSPPVTNLDLALGPDSVVVAADLCDGSYDVPVALSPEQIELRDQHNLPMLSDTPRMKARGKVGLSRRLSWRVVHHSDSDTYVCVPTGVLKMYGSCGLKGIPDGGLPDWVPRATYADMYVVFEAAQTAHGSGSVVASSVQGSPTPSPSLAAAAAAAGRRTATPSRPRRAAQVKKSIVSSSSDAGSDSEPGSSSDTSIDSIVPQAKRMRAKRASIGGAKRAGGVLAAEKQRQGKYNTNVEKLQAASRAISRQAAAAADTASESGEHLVAAAIDALRQQTQTSQAERTLDEMYKPLYQRIGAWMNVFFDDFELSLLCQDAAASLDQLRHSKQVLPGLLRGVHPTCTQAVDLPRERRYADFCLRRITSLAPKVQQLTD